MCVWSCWGTQACAARGAHPFVVAALPERLVVKGAAEQRGQLGLLLVALAVLDVLVRDARPLDQVDEVKRLELKPNVGSQHVSLPPNLGLLDRL